MFTSSLGAKNADSRLIA